MDDSPYTNRELKEMFKDVKGDLTEIKTQTTKTNGSVADINRWRERVNGGLAASGVFMAFVVVPILGWSLYILVNINQTVHQAVDQALSAYNIVTK